MKRIVIGIVLVVGMVFGVWGNGNFERQEDGQTYVFRDAIGGLGDRQLKVEYAKSIEGNIFTLDVNFPDREYNIEATYVYMRYNNEYYKTEEDYLIHTGEELAPKFSGLNYDLIYTAKDDNLTGMETLSKIMTSPLNYGYSSFQIGGAESGKNNKIILPAFGEFNVEIVFEYYIDTGEYVYMVSEFLKTTYIPEFFESEKQILDKLDEVMNAGEIEKKFMIMKELLKGQINESYTSSTPEFLPYYYESHALWQMARNFGVLQEGQSLGGIKDIPNDTIVNKVHLAKWHFFDALSTVLQFSEEEVNINGEGITLPYLNFSKESLRKIYSPLSRRDPYIATFMYLYFIKNKPLLDFTIKKNVDYPYDYKNYRETSHSSATGTTAYPGNGIINNDDKDGELIAKSALKYLTWGVEYTPGDATDNLNLGQKTTPIYWYFSKKENPGDKNFLEQWFVNSSVADRKLSYLHQPDKNLPTETDIFHRYTYSPKKMQILDVNIRTNEINLMAPIHPGAKLSRIDVWTSRNIAWESGRHLANNTTIKLNGEDYEPALDLLKLYDKEIAPGTGTKNLHIVRNNKTDLISVEYDFEVPQKIEGLLLVRGHAAKYSDTVSTNNNISQNKKTGQSYVYPENISPLLAKDEFRDTTEIILSENSPLVDGNLNTEWKSPGMTNYEKKEVFFVIDLGATHFVENMEIKWGRGYASAISVSTSSNNETFRKVPTTSSVSTKLIRANARYVRVDIIDGNPIQDPADVDRLFRYTIKEVKIFSKNLVNIVVNGMEKKFKEIVINPVNDSYLIFTDETKNRPGSGVRKYEFSNGNTEAVYSYFILNDPVDCNDLIIEFMEGNDFINISELMLFPENPVKYITEHERLQKEADKFYIQEVIDFKAKYPENTHVMALDPEEAKKYTGEIKNVPLYLNSSYINSRGHLTQANYRKILFNGDFYKCPHNPFWSLGNDAAKLQFNFAIDLRVQVDIKQIVTWEVLDRDSTSNAINLPSTKVKESFKAYSSTNKLFGFNSPYFDAYTALIEPELNNLLTTPFYEGQTYGTLGNPIPYTPFGVDSPKTFNYKMTEQVKAFNHLKKMELDPATNEPTTSTILRSTYARNHKYQKYITEMAVFEKENKELKISKNDLISYENENLYKSILTEHLPNNNSVIGLLKPFLPNLIPFNPVGFIPKANSLYSPDKTAGVDSLGLLLGAIAMSGVEGVEDLNNRDIGKLLDEYYRMAPNSEAFGLESDGTPAYYPDEGEGVLNYRITRADLEKMTVVVPDISLIRVGDILVNNDPLGQGLREVLPDQESTKTGKDGLQGEPHIGIVVKIMWENNQPPPYGVDFSQYWDKILVVSTRRGLQNATIGLWGHNGMFGGFTTNPGKYHIRRLVKRHSIDPDQMLAHGNVEWIKDLKKKKWNAYNAFDVPASVNNPIHGLGPVAGEEEWYLTSEIMGDKEYAPYMVTDTAEDRARIREEVLKTQMRNLINHDKKYLEEFPPTSLYKKAESSIFKQNGMDSKMIITQPTGWRTIGRPGRVEVQYKAIEEKNWGGGIPFIHNIEVDIPQNGLIDEEDRKGLLLNNETTTEILSKEYLVPVADSQSGIDELAYGTEFGFSGELTIYEGTASILFGVDETAGTRYELEIQPVAEGSEEMATISLKDNGDVLESWDVDKLYLASNYNYEINIDINYVMNIFISNNVVGIYKLAENIIGKIGVAVTFSTLCDKLFLKITEPINDEIRSPQILRKPKYTVPRHIPFPHPAICFFPSLTKHNAGC